MQHLAWATPPRVSTRTPQGPPGGSENFLLYPWGLRPHLTCPQVLEASGWGPRAPACPEGFHPEGASSPSSLIPEHPPRMLPSCSPREELGLPPCTGGWVSLALPKAWGLEPGVCPLQAELSLSLVPPAGAVPLQTGETLLWLGASHLCARVPAACTVGPGHHTSPAGGQVQEAVAGHMAGQEPEAARQQGPLRGRDGRG